MRKDKRLDLRNRP